MDGSGNTMAKDQFINRLTVTNGDRRVPLVESTRSRKSLLVSTDGNNSQTVGAASTIRADANQ